MYIADGRVSLRDFEAEDIEMKINWINDPKNHRYLHYELPLEYEKTLKWFNNRDMKKRQDCVIEYDGIPVGLIGLLEIDPINRKAEYYITMGNHEFKRKGIATAASRLILEYAFENLMLQKVYLNVDRENGAACKLYEKVGFKPEGIFIRDMFFNGRFIDRVRYAIFADDLKGESKK